MKLRKADEMLSNTPLCLYDVTASYTQEEIITHGTLLCKSPHECVPTCTIEQHVPALMKKVVPNVRRGSNGMTQVYCLFRKVPL